MTPVGSATGSAVPVRLTQYAHGGGCACKIPPGELEAMVARLIPGPSGGHADGERLLVGLDDGDDAAVVDTGDGSALVSTADFFTPVVDDARDWGRIAAANALSDVYAMGGRPVVALNLWAGPGSSCPLNSPRRCWRERSKSPERPAASSAAGTASTARSHSTEWP
ncbi:selenide, water dikinase SelD [Streptomyces sp. PA03-3a]|nr:selenide, water dikinase SelD [Streptomyces sp. PA03-3a]